MKHHLPPHSSRVRVWNRPRPHQQGVALVLVLAFLVLITVLVLSFFSSVTTELTSSKSYASGAFTKQLSDSAVSTVIGTIREATSGGASIAWTSQPGMLRTYDDSGNALQAFKLYSSDKMVVPAFDPADDVDAAWKSKPSIFTDLNQPITLTSFDSSGQPVTSLSYPILDPGADLATNPTTGVEGFSLTNAPGYDTSKPAAADNNPAPMPVKWIYVLRDGTMTTPDQYSSTTGIASFGTGPTPTKTNPIVGRIAFWADDECCKLNLNTSSEPTPWDTPKAVTIQDLNYGRYQPAQKEFQRFPGHPFSNALSPVFFPNTSTLSAAQMQSIYDLIPKVQWGGSKAATFEATPTTMPPVQLDADRLFASADEVLFKPDRSPSSLITPEMLQRARFFLTTTSRAPEVNLFGQPRVSLWPIWSTPAKRTAFDKVAAFCGTVGGNEYYFQRNDSTSSTADWKNIARNQKVYKYLQNVTGKMIPGFGGQSFQSKWGGDRDQVLTEIFDYIRTTNLNDTQAGATLFADNVVGVNNSAAGKGQVTPIQIGTTKGFGRFYTISQAGMHFICGQEEDAGVITTANAADKLLAGERLVRASFIFEPWSPSLGYPNLRDYLYFDVKFGPGFTLNGQPLKMTSGGRMLQNGVAFQMYNGYNSSWDVSSRNHGGTAGIRILQNFMTGPNVYAWAGSAEHVVGANRFTGIKVSGNTMNFVGGTVTVDIYYGGSVNPSRLVQTLNFKIPDGKFPVPKLVRTGVLGYYRPGVGGQTFAPSFFWDFSRYRNSSGYQAHVPGPEYIDASRQWVAHNGPPGFKSGGVFRDEDVVRTIVPYHGDLRLIAAKKVVPDTDFAKVSESLWESTSDRMLHVFDNPQGSHRTYGHANEPNHTVSGTTVSSPSHRPGGDDRYNVAGDPKSGTLGGIPLANPDDQLTGSALVKYHWSRLPEIRPGAGKQYNLWNDYDNGISIWPDGAYINKPDEGNYNASSGSPYTYFNFRDSDDIEGRYFSPNRLVPSAGMLGSLPTGVVRGRPWETLLFRPEVRTSGANPHPGMVTPKDHLFMDLFWMPYAEPYPISEPLSTAGKVNLNYQIVPFSYIRRATALHGVLKAEEPLIIPNAAATYTKLWDGCVNDNNQAGFNSLPNDPKTTDPVVMTEWDKLYKGQPPYDQLRRPIDVDATLSQADDRFAGVGAFAGKPDVFRSASEICDLHLVRKGENLADYQSGKIWQDALATGDNTRERPYTNLYAKLTTRSNSFTVHVRAEALHQNIPSAAPASDARWAQWNERRDQVTSRYRGSTLIDRYVDPADPALARFDETYSGATEFEADGTIKRAGSLDPFYRFRVLSTKTVGP